MTLLTLRYDLRVPEISTSSHAEQYAAALDQAAWADQQGFHSVVLSEHHGVDDGFLPSPLVLAAAIAGRTRHLGVTIAALLVSLHDPVRLAEDLAVLDLASGGRVSVVAGLGYRQEEFDMAGIDRRDRGRLVEENLQVLLAAWTGEPFVHQGRTVRVTPRPRSRPHPLLLVGGSTDAAARRAARLRLPFMPAVRDPALAQTYRQCCAAAGFTEGWVLLPDGPGFVHVTEDPERDWARIAPYARYDAQTYHAWQPPGQRSAVDVDAADLDQLRQSGVYRVVTPDECLALAGQVDTLVFHPLMGGMPAELGWASLDLFARAVAPRLAAPGAAG